MAADKDKSQRRVYVLPTELVERIIAYQNEHGLQSEVEAARRLLDEALLSRDNWKSIVKRIGERLQDTKVMSDIAKDVLVGHPLIRTLELSPNYVGFTMTTDDKVIMRQDGTADVKTRSGKEYSVNELGVISESDIPF